MRHHHLVQPHNVLVSKRLEELDLAHGGDWEAILFVLHADALQGNEQIGRGVLRFVNLPKCSLANLIQNRIQVSGGRSLDRRFMIGGRWLRGYRRCLFCHGALPRTRIFGAIR